MTRFSPLWLQAPSYPASVDRRLLGALWPGGGANGGAVTPTTGMGLQVAPGSVAIAAPNGTGSVLCAWDAPETVTLDPSPPSGSNRIDLVIVQAHGQDIDGGSTDGFTVVFVKGAVASSPTAPAVPAGAIALAQVAVNGGAAAIVAGNITDRRSQGLSIPPPAPSLFHTAGMPIVGSAYAGQPVRFAAVTGAVVVSGNFGTVAWSPPFPNALAAYTMIGSQWQYPTAFIHSSATLGSVTVSAHNLVDGSMRNGTLGYALQAIGY